MKVSDIGLMALICREGIALGWYYDSVKVATIGIGHTAMAGPPAPKVKGTLTIREAFDLFHHDIEKYAETVRKTIKSSMAQHEFDAFVSICYNIGQGGFAGSTFAKKFNAGDKAGCAKAIMYWKKPKEIIGRRTSERDQFKGKIPNKFIATVYEPGMNGRLGRASSMDLVRELQVAKPVTPPRLGPKPTEKPPIAQKPAPAPVAPAKQPSGVLAAFLRLLASIWKGK